MLSQSELLGLAEFSRLCWLSSGLGELAGKRGKAEAESWLRFLVAILLASKELDTMKSVTGLLSGREWRRGAIASAACPRSEHACLWGSRPTEGSSFAPGPQASALSGLVWQGRQLLPRCARGTRSDTFYSLLFWGQRLYSRHRTSVALHTPQGLYLLPDCLLY